jgi:hypothetical protein
VRVECDFVELVELERDLSYMRAALDLLQSWVTSAEEARHADQAQLREIVSSARYLRSFLEARVGPIEDIPEAVYAPFCEALDKAD